MMELQSVRKYFREGFIVRALDGMDLSIEPGEYIAITGASGSGKSTLLSILGCLERPTSRIYTIDSLDTAELSEQAISSLRARNFGFVFQSFYL